MLYRVSWVIDIEAESAFEAARRAKLIQLDLQSIANVFDVIEHEGAGTPEIVDLDLYYPKVRFKSLRGLN